MQRKRVLVTVDTDGTMPVVRLALSDHDKYYAVSVPERLWGKYREAERKFLAAVARIERQGQPSPVREEIDKRREKQRREDARATKAMEKFAPPDMTGSQFPPAWAKESDA